MQFGLRWDFRGVPILISFATARECLHWHCYDIANDNHITPPLQWGMWALYVKIEEFIASMGWEERPGVRKCKGPWNDTDVGACKIWCATDETGLLISWRTTQYDEEGWEHYNASDRPRKMIHSTRRHNEENVNGWELRQAPPQQVTHPLTHIRKRGVGFKATQSSLGVSEDSKDIKDPKRSGKSQVKVYLELNL